MTPEERAALEAERSELRRKADKRRDMPNACATPESASIALPPAADLRVPAKPVPTEEILTSAKASAAHSSAVEAWGDRMALQIGRLCRWTAAIGAKGLDCPAP